MCENICLRPNSAQGFDDLRQPCMNLLGLFSLSSKGFDLGGHPEPTFSRHLKTDNY